MSTQIKRLYLNSLEFVPITLAEAVVVNTSNIPELATLNITTLDRVLRTALGLVGYNTSEIGKLESTVEAINTELANKQNILTPGTGITISPNGVISVSHTAELYKVAPELPAPSADHTNTIYVIPVNNGNANNLCIEYLCVPIPNSSDYRWEEIGKIQTDVDLSGYITSEIFNTTISQINTKISEIETSIDKNLITAISVTTSDKTNVVVNYTIPSNLYDSLVNINS